MKQNYLGGPTDMASEAIEAVVTPDDDDNCDVNGIPKCAGHR